MAISPDSVHYGFAQLTAFKFGLAQSQFDIVVRAKNDTTGPSYPEGHFSGITATVRSTTLTRQVSAANPFVAVAIVEDDSDCAGVYADASDNPIAPCVGYALLGQMSTLTTTTTASIALGNKAGTLRMVIIVGNDAASCRSTANVTTGGASSEYHMNTDGTSVLGGLAPVDTYTAKYAGWIGRRATVSSITPATGDWGYTAAKGSAVQLVPTTSGTNFINPKQVKIGYRENGGPVNKVHRATPTTGGVIADSSTVNIDRDFPRVSTSHDIVVGLNGIWGDLTTPAAEKPGLAAFNVGDLTDVQQGWLFIDTTGHGAGLTAETASNNTVVAKLNAVNISSDLVIDAVTYNSAPAGGVYNHGETFSADLTFKNGFGNSITPNNVVMDVVDLTRTYTFNDFTPNARNLTQNGTVPSATAGVSRFGLGVDVPGDSTNYLTRTDSAFNLRGDMSLTLVFELDALPSSAKLLCGVTDTNQSWDVFVQNNGNVYFRHAMSPGGLSVYEVINGATTGTLYRVTVTRNHATGALYAKVNGVETLNTTYTPNSILSGAGAFQIGKEVNAKIYEMRIWDRKMSQSVLDTLVDSANTTYQYSAYGNEVACYLFEQFTVEHTTSSDSTSPYGISYAPSNTHLSTNDTTGATKRLIVRPTHFGTKDPKYYFGGTDLFKLSRKWRFSTSNVSVNDRIYVGKAQDPSTQNITRLRGQALFFRAYVYNVRSELLGSVAGNFNVRPTSSETYDETSGSFTLASGLMGGASATYTIDTDESTGGRALVFGSVACSGSNQPRTGTASNGNFAESDLNTAEWTVSATIPLESRTQKEDTRNGDAEDRDFTIGEDVIYAYGQVVDHQGDAISGVTVTFDQIDPRSTNRQTATAASGGDGWTPAVAFETRPPASSGYTWIQRVSASWNGNTGSNDQTIRMLSAFSGSKNFIVGLAPVATVANVDSNIPTAQTGDFAVPGDRILIGLAMYDEGFRVPPDASPAPQILIASFDQANSRVEILQSDGTWVAKSGSDNKEQWFDLKVGLEEDSPGTGKYLEYVSSFGTAGQGVTTGNGYVMDTSSWPKRNLFVAIKVSYEGQLFHDDATLFFGRRMVRFKDAGGSFVDKQAIQLPAGTTTAPNSVTLGIDLVNATEGATYLKKDGSRALTGNLSAGGFKITNLGAPVAADDASTKTYVDAAATGLDVKASVRCATTVNLSATRSGNVLTASLNGVLAPIDGVTLALNDRVLVKNQSTGADNGIYRVTDLGSVITPWTMTRSDDADNSPTGEVTSGMFCFVSEGTTHADQGWVLATNDPITVNTTALTFTQFTGAGSFGVGAGLALVGSTIVLDYDDSTINLNGSNQAQIKDLGVSTGKIANDAVTLAKLGTDVSLFIKKPVRCATTANITLSGLQTIDDITVIAGDRVLVKNQTTPTENGIYTAASGAWSRADDADSADDLAHGYHVTVLSGTNNAATQWVFASPVTPGTTSVSFTPQGLLKVQEIDGSPTYWTSSLQVPKGTLAGDAGINMGTDVPIGRLRLAYKASPQVLSIASYKRESTEGYLSAPSTIYVREGSTGRLVLKGIAPASTARSSFLISYNGQNYVEGGGANVNKLFKTTTPTGLVPDTAAQIGEISADFDSNGDTVSTWYLGEQADGTFPGGWTKVNPRGTDGTDTLTVQCDGQTSKSVSVVVHRTAPTFSVAPTVNATYGASSGNRIYSGEYIRIDWTGSSGIGILYEVVDYTGLCDVGASAKNAWQRTTFSIGGDDSVNCPVIIEDRAGNTATQNVTVYRAAPPAAQTATLAITSLNQSPKTLYYQDLVGSSYDDNTVAGTITVSSAPARCRNSNNDDTSVILVDGASNPLTIVGVQVNDVYNQAGAIAVTAEVSSQATALARSIRGKFTDQYRRDIYTSDAAVFDYNAEKSNDLTLDAGLVTPFGGLNKVYAETFFDAYVPASTSERGIVSMTNAKVEDGFAKKTSTGGTVVMRVLLPTNNASNTQYGIKVRGSGGELTAGDGITVEWTTAGGSSWSAATLGSVFTGPTGATALDVRITFGASTPDVEAVYVGVIE